MMACRPEFTHFSMYLRQLVDRRELDSMIPEILSRTRYDDLHTRRFLEEKLTGYAARAGLMAFNGGVRELEITVDIYIRNMARRRLLQEQEIVRYISEQAIRAGNFGAVPASEASIKKLEVVKYDGVVGDFEENKCSICFEEFELEMEVTRMPCKHIFHGACLTQWLENSHLCPLCRYEMPI